MVRDIQGAWVLPHGLSEDELPSSVGEAAGGTHRALGEAERRVAEALAVHRGRVPLICASRSRSASRRAAFERIENLTRENVLVSSGDSYGSAVRRCGSADRPLTEDRKRELHRRVGALIADADGGDSRGSSMRAGTSCTGAKPSRCEAARRRRFKLGYSNDDLANAAPALRAALEVYRGASYDDYDRVPLLGMLALAGFFADRGLALEFGPEAIATYQRVLGLDLQRKLARVLGGRVAFFVAIAASALRYMLRQRRGVSGFRELITQFVSCTTALAAVCAVCLDPAGARVWADKLEPLRFLGQDSAPTTRIASRLWWRARRRTSHRDHRRGGELAHPARGRGRSARPTPRRAPRCIPVCFACWG